MVIEDSYRTAWPDVAPALPFSKPYATPDELPNLARVLSSDHAHGDGPFTAAATTRLRAITGSPNVLLTTSGTHALEMAVQLLGIGAGDEVILPSFTFTSAANAVARTGARCVFVDLQWPSGNIDPNEIADAIVPATKAIVVMHYGGVPVDIEPIAKIAEDAGVPVIEDNAHGLGVETRHGTLGSIGALGIQSFHDTKNVHCGEGGALLIRDRELFKQAEIIREKGTNRSQFLRGQVDKYSWIDLGSSYLPSELNAAVLDSQLEHFGEIQRRRFSIWNRYAAGLAEWADRHRIELMDPSGSVHAAHLFFLLMPTRGGQDALISHLRSRGVTATFHYVPLDSSPAGLRYGRTLHALNRTDDFSRRIVRLPLWAGMTDDDVERVIAAVTSYSP